ncbi:MAG: LCP family protein [Thermoleophilia bacterium]|nr:LCP family protein [Thermoleophilia bacterium]
MRTTLKRGAARAAENGSGDGLVAAPIPPLSPVTRYGPPRRRLLATTGRVVLWLLVSLLVVAGGLAGGVLLWWEHGVAATAPKTAAEREAQAVLDSVPPADQPAVAIVVGYDRRFGPQRTLESRSDTIMLIRTDPRRRTISLLSFPRDLLVEIQPCKGSALHVARINEAFTDCGVRGTIETVRKLTGIPVNYFITVNFRGFIKIVNQLGGVYVDVDRRYFNDNSGLGAGETYSAIDLHAGYQRLWGPNALAYVRYRHTDNDFYRNARQQEFVRAVKHQISGLGAAWKLRGIVSTVTKNVTVGSGGARKLDLETVLSYAKLAYELPSGNLFQVRIQGLTDNAEFDVLAPEEEIRNAVESFMNPDPDTGARATSAAVGEKPRQRSRRGPPPSQVSVEVLNGNGVPGAADDAAYLLSQRGYRAVNGGNFARQDVFETRVLFDPAVAGAEGAAEDMVKVFGDAEALEATPVDALQTTLRVVVGKTFHGTLAPVPKDTTPKHEPPNVTSDAAETAPLLRRAQARAGFPLLVPTLRETGSSLSDVEPIRVYKIREGAVAVRVVYNGPSGTDYWGIQETSWTDAPILEGPTLTRRIGGREYRLYYNGSSLHMVAFEESGAAYWVSNTLLDALSNETMLAIAKGLRPLRAR